MDKLHIEKIVETSASDHNETFSYVKSNEFLELFSKSIEMVYETINYGGCILSCGNGGSFSDAQHLSAEFTSKLCTDRKPLPSIALGTNSSNLTAIGNDFGFENIFSRELSAIANKNDFLIAITTSGNSPNIYNLVEKAIEFGLGARGLRSICEVVMLDAMFHYPSDSSKKKLTITSSYVKEQFSKVSSFKTTPWFSNTKIKI